MSGVHRRSRNAQRHQAGFVQADEGQEQADTDREAVAQEAGTLSTSHCRSRNTVSRMKSTPAMNTAASAVCHVNPSSLQTVKAMKAFSPM